MRKHSHVLCGHIKALLSGFVPDQEIKALVGVLVNLEIPTFKNVADDLSVIFSHALIGEFDILPSQTPHVGRFRIDLDVPLVKSRYSGSFKILNSILDLDPALASTQKIWAGMTNLKSVIYRFDSTLSRSDKSKSYRSITHTTRLEPEVVKDWRAFLDEYLPIFLADKMKPEADYHPVWAFASSEKRFAFVDTEGKCETLSRNDERVFDITNFLRIPAIRGLALRNPSEFLTRTLYGDPVQAQWILDDFPEPFSSDDIPIGQIGVAPKNGAKPRIVVVTSPVMGSLSYPLGKLLKSINSQTPMQWVDSHEGARRDIQKMLSKNVRAEKPDLIKSFDQSSFTDNFPYREVQRPVLLVMRELGWVSDYDIQIMDVICQGCYSAPVLGKDAKVHYGTGTPMGSQPSFPLGSLTMGLIAVYSFRQAKGRYPDRRDHFAWIVGDDAAIKGEDVKSHFERNCVDLGLVINESKCLESTRCVEFCSTFITPEGIFQKKKLPEFTEIGSLVAAISYYGIDQFVEGFPRFEEFGKRLLAVPYPYGAGEKIDERQSQPFGDIKSVVKAKIQAGSLKALQDDVKDAREHLYAFHRSGLFNSDLEGVKTPVPKHSVVHGCVPDGDCAFRPWLPPLPLEQAMLAEVPELLRSVSSAPLDSELSLESCRSIDRIYRYFLDRYPSSIGWMFENIPGRKPSVFKVAPDKGETKPRPSESQRLVDLCGYPSPSLDGIDEGGDSFGEIQTI